MPTYDSTPFRNAAGIGVSSTDDQYRKGYRDGWKDAMETFGNKLPPTPTPVLPGCRVCGIMFNGATGYACPRFDCPNAIRAL